MMTSMTDELFGKFRELIYQESDLHFTQAKYPFLEHQLRSSLSLEGADDYQSLYNSLRNDPVKLGELIQRLTTNKTFFFRNMAQFDALREVVFPEIIESRNIEAIRSWGDADAQAARRTPMQINIWSAGCSTGEETYSIAFTLLDCLKFPRAWDVEVLGTDISREVLDVARAGIYETEKLDETDPALTMPYMEKRGGRLAVKELPASIVKFHEANLKDISAEPAGRIRIKTEDGATRTLDLTGRFDVIFCRNVMIYFDRKGQQRLVDALFNCLKPGGYLFTGDSEPLHLFDHGYEVITRGEALFYRKPIF